MKQYDIMFIHEEKHFLENVMDTLHEAMEKIETYAAANTRVGNAKEILWVHRGNRWFIDSFYFPYYIVETKV